MNSITRRVAFASVPILALIMGKPSLAQPTAVNIPSATYPVGTQSWQLNNFQAGINKGFDAVFTPSANWPSGALFDVVIQLSFDGGTTFKDWISTQFTSDGTSPTPQEVSGMWPGVNDGSGGRKILYPTNIKASMTVHQSITMSISITPL